MAVDASPTTARCEVCANGLDFESWAAGTTTCRRCATAGPRIDYVVGPELDRVVGPGPPESAPVPAPALDEENAWLSELPPEMFDEIADELLRKEREPAGRAAEEAPRSGIQQLLSEMDLSSSARATRWAAWGFAGGFAGNAAVAKYAQMTTEASMSDFVAPMVIGGLVAGATAAVIAWGAAKLREA